MNVVNLPIVPDRNKIFFLASGFGVRLAVDASPNPDRTLSIPLPIV